MHHLMPQWRTLFKIVNAPGGGGAARLRNTALAGQPQCFVHGNGNSMKVKAHEGLWREMMARCRGELPS